jgi:hypothetical protein
MPIDEIQKAEPEGVRNRRLVEGTPTGQQTFGDLGSSRCIESIALPQNNPTAKAAFACGIFGLLLSLIAVLALVKSHYVWTTDVSYVGFGLIAALLGFSACILAFCGLVHLSTRPASGGLGWAMAGGACGLIAIVLCCAGFIDLLGYAG